MELESKTVNGGAIGFDHIQFRNNYVGEKNSTAGLAANLPNDVPMNVPMLSNLIFEINDAIFAFQN